MAHSHGRGTGTQVCICEAECLILPPVSLQTLTPQYLARLIKKRKPQGLENLLRVVVVVKAWDLSRFLSLPCVLNVSAL